MQTKNIYKQFLITIVVVLITTSISITALAQPQRGSREGMIESIRKTYYTNQLNLTNEEATALWPVYDNYLNELKQIRRNFREESFDQLELEEKVLAVRKKYRDSFKRILKSDERTNLLFKVELKFREIIKKEWQRRMANKQSAGALSKDKPE